MSGLSSFIAKSKTDFGPLRKGQFKLKNLLHKVFSSAQINLSIPDRFGHIVKPREWFLLPLGVIDEAVERIRDRSILKYSYEPETGGLREIRER